MEALRELCGPADPEVARVLRPKTLWLRPLGCGRGSGCPDHPEPRAAAATP